MAYKVNGKAYTEHALMDEVIYQAKIIVNNLVLKNTRLASEYETEETMLQADYLLAINNGSMAINFFPFTADMLEGFGYSPDKINEYLIDWKNIPKEDHEELLKYCCDRFVDEYVEKNDYYRALAGLPEYGTTDYDIYIDPMDPRILADNANTDFNFSAPIHTYGTKEINSLEAMGIMSEIRETHTGKHYRYLKNLGVKRIDPITARIAKQWDILYIPEVEYLVKSRFKEVYAINRDIYLRRTYQEAYTYGSTYYDEMVMIMVVCQSLTDIITELPEWYIRRDIFDLRSVQYFLDSQGVAFYREIPIKYQIKIVKNLNRLIRYKSTTKNIHDILEIFRREGTTIYKYYMFKKYLYTKQEEEVIPPPVVWHFGDDSGPDGNYDFGYEDDYIDEILDTTDFDILDFMCDDTDEIDHSGTYRDYDFGDEDCEEIPSAEVTDEKEDYKEKDRTVYDEYGNVYALEFVRVPIDEAYDDYIKDQIYREDYDAVTYQDKYWDGEDTHYYVRNKHLEKDFTIEGTKYMLLDYSVSAKDYYFQIAYFMNLLFSSRLDTEDIQIPLPNINADALFSLTDICLFVLCLSNDFLGLSNDVKTPPALITEKKHDFYRYWYAEGGWFYDGADEQPLEPEPEPHPWMLDYYDFGYEDVDNIYYDEVLGTMYDFGYHNDIDPDKETLVYEFKEITDTSIEIDPVPIPPEFELREEDRGKITILGSDEEIQEYLNHTGAIKTDDWIMGHLYDYGQEGNGSGFYDFGDENLIPGIWDTNNWRAVEVGEEENYTEDAKFALEFGDEEVDKIEYLDLYHETLNAGDNSVGDSMDYDYYDEGANVAPMPSYYHHRMYDYNSGDPDYEPVERPPINQPYPWWREEGIESHHYTDIIDGRFPKNTEGDPDAFGPVGGQGGRVRYSEINRESYYNWMSYDNPQLFVPHAGRVLGFNTSVNLEEVKKNIGLRHSEFGFEHGYTLEDFGCENFVATKKIRTVEELLRVYQTNKECYDNLYKHIIEDNTTRDKIVTMDYLHDILFTVQFDPAFYRLKSGQIASNLLQVLQERNMLLYKQYYKIMEEKDPQAIKDMIRDLLNDMVSILEYYVNLDDLKYAFSWIPTNSIEAITQYIHLLINFFKSWKVYFLDPHTTFILDDKYENRSGIKGDQIVESKIDQWVGDNLKPMDGVKISIILNLAEEIYAVNKEIVDIMAYQQWDTTRPWYIDGEDVILTEDEEDNGDVADGGHVDILRCTPYIKYNAGNVAARDQIYELNGGTPKDMINYLTLDGGDVGQYTQFVIPDNQREEYTSLADGGHVVVGAVASQNMATRITPLGKMENDVILSTKKFNSIEVRDDGLYLGGTFLTKEDIDAYLDELSDKKTSYREFVDQMEDKLNEIPTMENIGEIVTNQFEELFACSKLISDDYHNQESINNNEDHVKELNDELISWFNDVVPYKNWHFENVEKEDMVTNGE